MDSKLVIFDGNAIMHRAFHAIPPLTTKDGEAINALYGLVSILINIVENLKPTHIIFCFDEKEPTFRNKLLPTYQSQRPETPSQSNFTISKSPRFFGVCKYSCLFKVRV